MAAKEDCLLIEVLEKSLELYQKNYKGSRPKKPQKKLSPYHLKGFECDNCGDEYYNKTAYSYAPKRTKKKLASHRFATKPPSTH